METAQSKSQLDPLAGAYSEAYSRDGFISPMRIISEHDATYHRAQLEDAETKLGKSLHYVTKVHTILTSPWALATHKKALDLVEELIGPDILIYNVSFIIKEAGTESFVSWHQDLTYWGFNGDQQVSMWLALSPAAETSGCMRMIAGSHRTGQMPHSDTRDENNVLSRGQEVTNIDERKAVTCPLQPGEASFHHGWTLHASSPNQGNDRRIGLNVQYIAPSLRQINNAKDTAILVRGRDEFGYYMSDIPAITNLDSNALQRLAALDKQMKDGWQKDA